MNDLKKIEEAKAFLKSKGYYTDMLWMTEDVRNKFNCTEEEAQEVLNSALNGGWLIEETNESITIVAESFGFEEVDEENN